MLNLLNCKDFQSKLKEGLDNKELIYTQELRGVGKTYNLIKFAKYNDLNVVMSKYAIVGLHKSKYDYDKIYCQHSEDLRDIDCIVDEGVDIELLKSKGVDILTGFSDIKKTSELSKEKKDIKKKSYEECLIDAEQIILDIIKDKSVEQQKVILKSLYDKTIEKLYGKHFDRVLTNVSGFVKEMHIYISDMEE